MVTRWTSMLLLVPIARNEFSDEQVKRTSCTTLSLQLENSSVCAPDLHFWATHSPTGQGGTSFVSARIASYWPTLTLLTLPLLLVRVTLPAPLLTMSLNSTLS